MKYILSILFLIVSYVSFGNVKDTVPNNPFPTQYSTGFFRHGVDKSDSGHVERVSDTAFIPRWPGMKVMWQQASDTSIWFWTGQRWLKTLKQGDVASVLANQGLSLNGDTAQLGGRRDTTSELIGYSKIKVRSRLTTGSPNTGLILTNQNAANAVYPQQNPLADSSTSIYDNSLLYMSRLYNDDDTVHSLYSAPLQIFSSRRLSPSNTRYNNTTPGGDSIMTSSQMGIFVTTELFADTTFIQSAPYGLDFSAYDASWQIGGNTAAGYNHYYLNISSQSNISHPYPLVTYRSGVDLARGSGSGTYKREMYGNGHAGYIWDYRNVQGAGVTAGSAELGSYHNKLYGYMAYGDLGYNPSSPSKAKSLAVAENDSVFAFISMGMNLPLNNVRNGYGFASMGVLDYNYFAGRTRIGGILPTNQVDSQTYLFQVNGQSLYNYDSTSQEVEKRQLFINNTGSFNTTSSVLSNYGIYLNNNGTRASGSNSLTNYGMRINTNGGQNNYALKVDTGKITFGHGFELGAQVDIAYKDTTTSTTGTGIRTQTFGVNRLIVYNNDDLVVPSRFNTASETLNSLAGRDSLQLTSHYTNGGHASLFPIKYSGYGDTTFFIGRSVPSDNLEGPATGFLARLNLAQSGLTSANPNLYRGYWAALSASVSMSGNFNQAQNVIWINTGTGQIGGTGTITNGYALYINGLKSDVTNKYALYQQGTLDTSYFAGKIRIPNLVTQTDTSLYKPTVVDASGNLFKFDSWGASAAVFTANNGLNKSTPTNAQLGGDLVQNTTVGNIGQDFGITFNRLGTSAAVTVQAVSSVGTALNATTTSGTALVARSSSGLGGLVGINPSTTNTFDEVFRLERPSTGTATNGIGGYMSFTTETSDNSLQQSGRIGTIWDDVTTGTRTSRMDFWTQNSATISRKMSISGPGQITLDGYPALTQSTDTTNHKPLAYNTTTGVVEPMANWLGGGAAGANTALSNLASVAINTSLVSDAYNTDALGTSALAWSDLFLGNGSIIEWSTAASTADITLTHSSNLLTLAGGDLTVAGVSRLQSGSLTTGLVLGADQAATTITDATNKIGLIVTPHYNTAQSDVFVLRTQTTSTANSILIGGGSGSLNAATSIAFNTGVTNTSGAGVQRMLINSSGQITFSNLAGTGTRLPTVTSTGQFGALANGSDGEILKLVSGTAAWTASYLIQDYSVVTADPSDFSIATTFNYCILPDLAGAADANLTLPGSPRTGQQMTIHNKNSDVTNTWSFVTTVQDAAGSTVTAIVNDTAYQLVYDGTAWVIIN